MEKPLFSQKAALELIKSKNTNLEILLRYAGKSFLVLENSAILECWKLESNWKIKNHHRWIKNTKKIGCISWRGISIKLKLSSVNLCELHEYLWCRQWTMPYLILYFLCVKIFLFPPNLWCVPGDRIHAKQNLTRFLHMTRLIFMGLNFKHLPTNEVRVFFAKRILYFYII